MFVCLSRVPYTRAEEEADGTKPGQRAVGVAGNALEKRATLFVSTSLDSMTCLLYYALGRKKKWFKTIVAIFRLSGHVLLVLLLL